MRMAVKSSELLESGGGEASVVVVVGVKVDSRSKELLVKGTQSGDRVIALHVLDPSVEDESDFLSLVKAFDSMLVSYEGFCNLKQVDLKLKVCKGSPVHKIILQEAKSCGATSLIVGTSGVDHKIRSRPSVAKYCSRNLQNNVVSVMRINNGKIVFGRELNASCVPLMSSDLDQGGRNYAAIYPDQKPTSTSECLTNLDPARGDIVPYSVDNNSNLFSSKIFSEGLNALTEKYSATCQLFSYQELLLATNNFIPENLIGKGGSCRVYRGCLPGGQELAVKILKPSEDILKQFVSEIEIISSSHRKNIISLVGFCFEENKLLLVYNILSRGSLADNLHATCAEKSKNFFGWDMRYKVAVGVAEALDYLHSSVIHRDVKSSNILLSDDFEPKLSDFGLATRASSLHHMCTSDVSGTFGYLAPEYFMNGKLNEKLDVYAFGVVLLELLTGRKPINDGSPKGKQSLVMWAKDILKDGKISELQDPELVDAYDQEQFDIMVESNPRPLASSTNHSYTVFSVAKFSGLFLRTAKLVDGVKDCQTIAVKWYKSQTQLHLTILCLLLAIVHHLLASSDADPLVKGRTAVHLFTSLQSAFLLSAFLLLAVALLLHSLLPLPRSATAEISKRRANSSTASNLSTTEQINARKAKQDPIIGDRRER
ncbi:hypothetical protein SASPL_157937 [Salvia splendens]|uniref:Protein kinase domain-containing protein n=1 Tax=Salvia splendens TaxID=180675 RepID=A0A8X8YTF2_SALSN|nr:hypothetical protein SASPL_157937 [Salvia splendens]